MPRTKGVDYGSELKDGKLWAIVDGKRIGYVLDRQFVKKVDPVRHQLRSPPAWALDAAVFDWVREQRCRRIVLEHVDGSTLWYMDMDGFDRHKVEFERGHLRQYFVLLRHWHVTDRREQQREMRL